MPMDMNALLIGALTIWAFALVPMVCAVSIDLQTDTPATYSTFMTTLRNLVKDHSKEYYNIPMMPAPVKPPTYFLVELIASNTKTITLALARNDLYVWAYLDQFEGKPRTHFFPDAPSNAKTTLFTTAKIRETIKYDSNYNSIEDKAKSNRRIVGMGIGKLKSSILKDVYGKKVDVVLQAKFFLIAIQTVAEAMRFKYIENQVLDNFPNGFTPDFKVISLENEWSKISKAFVNSKDGTITPALALKDANNKDWSVTKVAEIVADMSLLSYNTGGKTTVTQIFSQIFRFFKGIVNNNVEHRDL